MTGKRKNNLRTVSGSEQVSDYFLSLKAVEIYEIVRHTRERADAEGLIVDLLKELQKAPEKKGVPHAPKTSGCMAKTAGRKNYACDCCSQVRRMFARPNGQLWCAECIVDEFVADTR